MRAQSEPTLGCILGTLNLSVLPNPNFRQSNHCYIALGIHSCVYCQNLTLFNKQLKYSVSGTKEHVFDFLNMIAYD
jgi:hypothetical protein